MHAIEICSQKCPEKNPRGAGFYIPSDNRVALKVQKSNAFFDCGPAAKTESKTQRRCKL